MSGSERDEARRLDGVLRSGLLESEPEAAYETIVEQACRIADVPIALITVIDRDRQWFKARRGVEVDQTPRALAFCDVAIADPTRPLVVADTRQDLRFRDHPLVTGDPGIRFYAGFPFTDEHGRGLGTLCVIDQRARRLGPDQFAQIHSLATIVQELVRLRLVARDLDEDLRRARLVERGFASADDGPAALELRRSERRLASLVDPSPDPVLLVSSTGHVEATNRAALVLSADRSSLVGRHVRSLGLPRPVVRSVARAARQALTAGEPAELARLWVEPAGGSPGWYRVRIVPVPDEQTGTRSAFVSAIDVTETVEHEARLAALALVDPLTGANNRAALYDRLEQAIGRCERGTSKGIGLAALDLDHFKALNDTFGHDAGDTALVAVVDALRPAVRPQDTVARLGGDEFVVVFDDVSEADAIETLAPRLAERFSGINIPVGDSAVRVAASFGVTWSAGHTTAREALAQADAALLNAKRHGRNRIWFANSGAAGSFPSDLAMRRDLASALDRDQFALHYQPIVDAEGDAVAVEALLRWHHPELGVLQPAEFIGVLVDTGLIGTVGQWMLRRAFADAQQLRRLDLGRLAVHVNLSPGEVAGTQASSVIRGLLHEFDLAPGDIVVEVTEQALMGTVVSSSALAELASTGVRLALDDFGTGSSSLSHLRHRPLHGLKLDRSFVAGIGRDETDMTILSGAIEIARRLGLDVVAEGVETDDQLTWLLDQGCTHVQGWLMGRPVPLEEFIDA